MREKSSKVFIYKKISLNSLMKYSSIPRAIPHELPSASMAASKQPLLEDILETRNSSCSPKSHSRKITISVNEAL
jgi:hypothetical protein